MGLELPNPVLTPEAFAANVTNELGVVTDTASDPNCLPPLLVGAASAGAIGGLLPAAATSLAFLS